VLKIEQGIKKRKDVRQAADNLFEVGLGICGTIYHNSDTALWIMCTKRICSQVLINQPSIHTQSTSQ